MKGETSTRVTISWNLPLKALQFRKWHRNFGHLEVFDKSFVSTSCCIKIFYSAVVQSIQIRLVMLLQTVYLCRSTLALAADPDHKLVGRREKTINMQPQMNNLNEWITMQRFRKKERHWLLYWTTSPMVYCHHLKGSYPSETRESKWNHTTWCTG